MLIVTKGQERIVSELNRKASDTVVVAIMKTSCEKRWPKKLFSN
jgi:hypothetical protein